jgi:peptidoglycan hydrolase-like amidase
MLKANEIPRKEPLLRVGIILPQDSKRSVQIELTADPSYSVNSDNSTQFNTQDTSLKFTLSDNTIYCKDHAAKRWIISPFSEVAVRPESGIEIKDVIAGRGFHWQKPIDIIVSGTIEIGIFENSLILTNELPLETYLMCVATSEMGAACPSSLIESQTIAARSWMLANIEQKHVAMGMDVCNDDCCQRYQGNANLTDQSIKGAINTSGQVLLYGDKICDARYSKSCGGKMEAFSHIWPGPDLPYLQTIPDAEPGFSHPALSLSDEYEVKNWIDDIPKTFCSPAYIQETELKMYLGSVDEEGTYFRWELSYTQDEMNQLLNHKLGFDSDAIIQFTVKKRGGSGRVTALDIKYLKKNGHENHFSLKSEYAIREAMHKGFLYSSCFYIKSISKKNSPTPDKFIIKGAGWGHGAGYCQIGALGMSLAGYDTKEILQHYYPGSVLERIY